MRLDNEQRGRAAGAYLLGLGTGRAPLLHRRSQVQRAAVQADAFREAPRFIVQRHVHHAITFPGLGQLTEDQLQVLPSQA